MPSDCARRAGKAPGIATWFLCALVSGIGVAAGAQVALELRVPKAETWVLGDPIPLYWRFSNQSAGPLGFMWEGCCRLNGRLDVRRGSDGGPLETVPPSQALAHMFAKADRLEPGIPKDYDTLVSDWVAIPGTGRYVLEGTYRGVLPTQFPQVPRGLAVWKESATSRPVELAILGVDDYLRERSSRIERGGLKVTLEGPGRLVPLAAARFTVTLENRSAEARALKWPDDVAFWVLDSGRRRVAPMAVIPGVTTPLTVPAGGSVVRAFEVAADRFESEPLGDFEVFVDLAEGSAGPPRVPSNVVPLVWRIDSGQVMDLLERAASGAGTGARNAPLKLLRIYLGELGPTLSGLDRSRLSADARALADRLDLAARLRPHATRPGSVDLAVAVSATGGVRWSERCVEEALRAPRGDVVSQASEILGVRRHLGWEVTLVLVPDDDATMGVIGREAGRMTDGMEGWAGPAEMRLGTGGTNAPVRLVWRGRKAGEAIPVAADSGVVRREGTRWVLEPVGVGLSRVSVPEAIRWDELRRLLEPAGTAGGRMELWVGGAPPGGA